MGFTVWETLAGRRIVPRVNTCDNEKSAGAILIDTGSVGGKRSAKKQLKMPHTDTADPQISGQINALIKKYAEGVNNNDAAAVAALCTEEAVFVTPEGQVYGRQDIEEWLTDAFQRLPKDFSNPPDQRSPHMIGTTGDAVWSTGNWGEALQGPNGDLIQVNGYWAAIFVREGGDWKLRMLTWNVTPPPAS